jgi:hypothetical protein
VGGFWNGAASGYGVSIFTLLAMTRTVPFTFMTPERKQTVTIVISIASLAISLVCLVVNILLALIMHFCP